RAITRCCATRLCPRRWSRLASLLAPSTGRSWRGTITANKSPQPSWRRASASSEANGRRRDVHLGAWPGGRSTGPAASCVLALLVFALPPGAAALGLLPALLLRRLLRQQPLDVSLDLLYVLRAQVGLRAGDDGRGVVGVRRDFLRGFVGHHVREYPIEHLAVGCADGDEVPAVVVRRSFPLIQRGQLIHRQPVQDALHDAREIRHQVGDAAPAGAGVTGEAEPVATHQRRPDDFELPDVPGQVFG